VSAPRGKVFRYRDYAVDAERGVLSLRYELDGREFTERVTLSPGPRWHTGEARAAARLVFLLSGVSYYKTAAPPVIDGRLNDPAWQGPGARKNYGSGIRLGSEKGKLIPALHELVRSKSIPGTLRPSAITCKPDGRMDATRDGDSEPLIS